MASSEADDLFGDEDILPENNGGERTRDEDEISDAGSEADDLAIQRILQADNEDGVAIELPDGPIDQTGKADDAIDYEDLSDDDLPDEEPTTATSGDGPGLTDDGGTSFDTDDLFGEDDENPNYDVFDRPDKGQNGTSSESFDTALTLPSPPLYDVNFDPPPEVLALTGQDRMEQVKAVCPQFELGVIAYPNEWLHGKHAYYRYRTDPKPPKPLTHPKISLDIAQDQERTFRSAGTGFTTSRAQRLEEAAARGIILDLEPEEEEVEVDHFDYTPLDDNTVITPAGATVADLRLALIDFRSCLEDYKPSPEEAQSTEEDEWMAEYGDQPTKKQKLSDFTLIDQPVYPVPSFSNFEELTAQIGSRVVLDLNDPQILIAPTDEQQPSKKRLLNGKLKHGANAKNPLSRFNFSNDHAYDALRANNQSKVRASVGSIGIEHSMPAIKCSWPYYKVKHSTQELRAFHRMPLRFNKFVHVPISFSKSSTRKRKHMKGLSTQEIYSKTSDLSLSDNSTAILLEYSEEIPTVLSNFGMGNRIINYYRKTSDEDQSRPKSDVGETQVLQPTDESPFNKFGKVEPGEAVLTLHNSMYRAPIFKHTPKPNDFLVIRSTTGSEGTNWHLRNIDHMYVVGQELPSAVVPGPHSRVVTNASKERMKMLSFRMIRHNPKEEVKIGDITSHIADSTDMQNRQKLKEFLKYDKESKTWKFKEDHNRDQEEKDFRAFIKPETVCLIDAMHVGSRQLEDAGYAQNAVEYNDDDDKVTDSLDQQLAPWRTTKAFMDASANQAMLELRGPGDPSGCGMALSMIKTSMKGGFIKNLQAGPMGTSADAMERQRKANGGHDYNVHEQEAKYAQVLDDTWRTQKALLSDAIEHTENDEEDLRVENEQRLAAETPAIAGTPANFDDSASMMSEARSSKQLRISRQVRNANGDLETYVEVIRDPRVAREYARQRAQREAENIDIYDIQLTGDPDADKAKRLKAQQELARLTRNKERREHRERMKAKKNGGDGENDSPAPATPGPSDVVGTTSYGNGVFKEKGKKAKTIPGTTARKCANCGASGHIKTNRKLCPLLNGEWPNGVQPVDWGMRGGSRSDNNAANGNDASASITNTNGVSADVESVHGMNGTSTPTTAFDHEHQNGNGNGFGNGATDTIGFGMDMDMELGDDSMDLGMGGGSGAISPTGVIEEEFGFDL